jgi:PTH1 family peptidyl-tRNA hydrolase
VVLAKPETYMNLSGVSVAELVEEYQVDPQQDLIVIYDDLDLPFGGIRVRQRGSAGSHNGMKSVIGAMGTQEFLRVRLGTGPEHPIASGTEYVLGQFRRAQYEAIDEMLDAAVEAVEIILREGPKAAMNRFNRRSQQEPEPQEPE